MKTLAELKETPNLLILETGEDGGTGVIKYGRFSGTVVWSNGGGWEHVSVSAFKKSYTPTWDEMCHFKDMFFREDETVVQYHPAREDYVNIMTNCLHLWRPIGESLPKPPRIYV